VDSALRYRAQLPLVESLLNEVGLKGSGLSDLTAGLRSDLNLGNEGGNVTTTSGVRPVPRNQPTPDESNDD
jgi:hypothetical protein